MNQNYEIYTAEEVPTEDEARLDGYMQALRDMNNIDKMEQIERLLDEQASKIKNV